jgi:hypothetical protein
MCCTTVLIAVSMALGQADAQKTFAELSDLLVGGTWVYKADDGTIVEHSYRKILDGKYLENTATAIAGGAPAVAIVGVDPSAGKVKFWTFGQDGYVGSSTATSQAQDIWLFKGEGKGPKGSETIEFKATKVNADEIKIDIISLSTDGVKQETKPEIWKRRK